MSKADLESKLREAGLKFKDEGGYFNGVFKQEDGRFQLFMIDYDADDFQGHQEYDFMSRIGSADDASAVKAACELAGNQKRGGIVIKNDLIMLKYEVGVNWDGDVMAAHLQWLCTIADKREATIFGVDTM